MKLLTLFQAHDFIASWARERNIPAAPICHVSHVGDEAEIQIDATNSRLSKAELADLRLNVESLYPQSPVALNASAPILYAKAHVPDQYSPRRFSVVYHPDCGIIRRSRKVRFIVLVQEQINETVHYGFRYVQSFEDAIWKCRPDAIASVKLKPLDYAPDAQMIREGAKLLMHKYADGNLFIKLDEAQSKIFQAINIEKNSKY